MNEIISRENIQKGEIKMGGGRWTRNTFDAYSARLGRAVDATGNVRGNYSAQEMFKSRGLASELNPYRTIRECRDSSEHPNTIPVILALDVTGSMGATAVEVAKKLNVVMTKLYDSVRDVEFMTMGIGDLSYDRAPLQVSQFESDIRIAEQLDKLYFEGGGGGNGFESYTLAWYYALLHTSLDCHKRGRKGLIITMGDEPLNPYLPRRELVNAVGDNVQGDIETNLLYYETEKRFDIHHLSVRTATCDHYGGAVKNSWQRYLDDEHYKVVGLDGISGEIVSIVENFAKRQGNFTDEVSAERSKRKGFLW